MWPLSSRGKGGKALMAGPVKKDFFAASLTKTNFLGDNVHKFSFSIEPSL